MTVFFYQSLNSNSSKQHGFAASNNQTFTRQTDSRMANFDTPYFLSLPSFVPAASDAWLPSEGPAQLIPHRATGYSGKRPDDETHSESIPVLSASKVKQTKEQIWRQTGTKYDLWVYGEMDSNHGDWSSIGRTIGKQVCAFSSGKCCNSFSAFEQPLGAMIPSDCDFLGAGDGWIAFRMQQINIVFVHVPNSIATIRDKTQYFYHNINSIVHFKTGEPIDVVMGDTNQSSADFTKQQLEAAVSLPFVNASEAKSFFPSDTFQLECFGTNSNGKKKYDVAVYNKASITLDTFSYVSQAVSVFSTVTSANPKSSLNAAAFTDHMGMILQVTKEVGGGSVEAMEMA